MSVTTINLTISSVLKDILFIKNVLLEIQSTMDRSKVVQLQEKLISEVRAQIPNELYNQNTEFESKLNDQVQEFLKTNVAMDSFLSNLLQDKKHKLDYSLNLVKNDIELKMQVSAG